MSRFLLRLSAAFSCVIACGGGASAVNPGCPPGQTSLDGTCVSQAVADYVGCIRATGATVAADNSRSLSAAAGAAGATASTQADVKDRLEKRYATVSDANALEIIRNCYARTGAAAPAAVMAPPRRGEVVVAARNFVRSNGVAVGALTYGKSFVTNGPPFTDQPNAVEYDIELHAGTFEIWSEYAASDARPAEMRFNGSVVNPQAFAATTGGWYESDCRWFKEATITAHEGVNTLALARPSYFPHLRTFKFVPKP